MKNIDHTTLARRAKIHQIGIEALPSEQLTLMIDRLRLLNEKMISSYIVDLRREFTDLDERRRLARTVAEQKVQIDRTLKALIDKFQTGQCLMSEEDVIRSLGGKPGKRAKRK